MAVTRLTRKILRGVSEKGAGQNGRDSERLGFRKRELVGLRPALALMCRSRLVERRLAGWENSEQVMGSGWRGESA